MKKVIFIILIFITTIKAQSKIEVKGDILEGSKIGNQSIQIWKNNVVMKQDNIIITCDIATRYLEENKIELTGNVIAIQDTLTLTTKHLFYYGFDKSTYSDSPLILDNKHVVLSADKGKYYFESKTAIVNGNVELYNKSRTLKTDYMEYYYNQAKAIAIGNSLLADSSSFLKSDSLIYLKNQEVTYGYGNVSIVGARDNAIITGDYFEDHKFSNYSLVKGNAILTQIDSSNNNQIDTLYIKADKFEKNYSGYTLFKAINNVKLLRKDFASVNEYTEYYKEKNNIITKRIGDSKPVLWSGNNHITGDSISIYISNNKLKSVDIVNNAFIISPNKYSEKRFDQIKADTLNLYFKNNNLQKVKSAGNVLSIYFNYDNNVPNGVIKASSKNSLFIFENNEIKTVKFYFEPVTEYYPENKLIGNEADFILPNFIIHNNKPSLKDFRVYGIKSNIKK